MLKKIDVRKVKIDGELIELQIFFTEDKKEVVKLNETYFYLSKTGLRILNKVYKNKIY